MTDGVFYFSTHNKPFKNPKKYLSFFSEVVESQTCGRLRFFTVQDTRYNQYDDRDDIGQRFDKLDLRKRNSAYIAGSDIKTAENNRTQNGERGAPKGKDNEGDGQPTEPFEKVYVVPISAHIIHNAEQSAESRNSATDARRQIFIARHIDSRGVRRSGILTHRAQVQTYAGTIENELSRDRDDNRQIHEDTVR